MVDIKIRELSDKEVSLIELLRSVVYGQVVIYMENSQPVRVEMIKESIML